MTETKPETKTETKTKTKTETRTETKTETRTETKTKTKTETIIFNFFSFSQGINKFSLQQVCMHACMRY